MSRQRKVISGYCYYDGTIKLVGPKVDMVTECLPVSVKRKEEKKIGESNEMNRNSFCR